MAGKKGIKVGKKKVVVGKKKKGGKLGSQQRVVSGFGVAGGQGNGLDMVARSHARMLADPCRANLGPSTYPGSNGAVVARFELDEILFTTSTVGAVVWAPGLASYAISPVLLLDNAPFNFQGLQGSAGNAFLASQTAAYRCVGACMQIYFPGTELNRSGFVGMGYAPASTITNYQLPISGGAGNTTTVANVRASQFHTERTPQNMVELKWKPGFGDQEWEANITSAQQVATNAATIAGRNCITMTMSGFPANTGIRVRTVGIYEYLPQLGLGQVTTASNAVITKNTLNDVLHSLDKTGNWFLETATKYGPMVSAAVGYATTLMV